MSKANVGALLRRVTASWRRTRVVLERTSEALQRAMTLLEERERTIAALRLELEARSYGESPDAAALRRTPEADCYRA